MPSQVDWNWLCDNSKSEIQSPDNSKSNSNPNPDPKSNPNATLNCQDTVGIDLLQVSQIFYNLNATQ